MICREVALSQVWLVYSLQDLKGNHSLEVEKTERPAWTVAHGFFLSGTIGHMYSADCSFTVFWIS
jgi:hypothetical protein